MYAFDRDGTVIGSLSDYSSNNPGLLKRPGDMQLIQPVASWINENGAVIISNQDGPTRKKGFEAVEAEFRYLMDLVPGIQACFWSVSKNGVDGAECHTLYRKPHVGVSGVMVYKSRQHGNFRKPSKGMALLASKTWGFQVTHYVGDLSGLPDYAKGKDSDRQFAKNAGLEYLDVRDFVSQMPQRV